MTKFWNIFCAVNKMNVAVGLYAQQFYMFEFDYNSKLNSSLALCTENPAAVNSSFNNPIFGASNSQITLIIINLPSLQFTIFYWGLSQPKICFAFKHF